MPQAAIDEISLYYERRGAGEPVLLIQGMSGTHLAWGDAFLAGLGDDLDVVAYDHRGVGDSTPQSDAFTIAELADDAAGLLDDLGWDTAHVVGDLDGRHGGPGARAAPPAADPHAGARAARIPAARRGSWPTRP